MKWDSKEVLTCCVVWGKEDSMNPWVPGIITGLCIQLTLHYGHTNQMQWPLSLISALSSTSVGSPPLQGPGAHPLLSSASECCPSRPCFEKGGELGKQAWATFTLKSSGSALKERYLSPFSLHLGRLRLRVALCCGHPTQVWRLRLSLLFIELQ